MSPEGLTPMSLDGFVTALTSPGSVLVYVSRSS